MKKRNAVSEFTSERNLHLLESFRRALAEESRITVNRAFERAAQSPAPRFWVSEARAAYVVGRMLAGEDPTVSMNVEKKEMFREIYSRFLALREERPSAPIGQLVFEIVNEDAPRTYISWQRARNIINLQRALARRAARGVNVAHPLAGSPEKGGNGGV